MTFTDIIDRVSQGILRDDLATSYPDIVNEALVEIQRRRSWQCMRALGNFTMPVGSSSISLAVDDDSNTTSFKELTSSQSPISVQHNTTQATLWVPCDVWTREKLVRRQSRLISNSILYSIFGYPNTVRRVNVPVFVDWVSGQPTLNTLYPIQANPMTFQVSYYGFLLALGFDESRDFTQLSLVAAQASTPQKFISLPTPAQRVLIRAPDTNANDVFIGPDSTASYRPMSPGDEFLIPTDLGTEVDLSKWYFQCADTVSTLTVIYQPGSIDENTFTINYPEMVIAKSKAIAFESINDPASADFEALYEKRFDAAAAQDAYQAVAGLDLRM